MTKPNIAELLNEPGCEHNHKKGQGKHGANKACTQQAQPGTAQGGCAFDGASIALVPITDAAHLVHGPIACAGNSWGSRGSLSSGALTYKMGFTTDISENDIIFGGEKKLFKAIAQITDRYQPPAIFVYSTCVTALIGDDLEAVCKVATEKYSTPIIPVHSPGFVGSKNLGNRLAGESLLDHVIGTAEPEYTTPYDINLIGEYNIAGELWGVLSLFEKVGIRVLSKITGDATYQEICYAHRAKLNVMICSKALINMGRKMEERYGIPYIEESFYGVADMNRCLRNIAQKLGDSALQQRVENLITEETAKLDVALAPYRARLKGKRMVLYTGGVKSWSIISAAQDLGIEVTATSTKKSTEEDKAKIKELLGKDGIAMAKGNAQELLRVIAKTNADLLVAGGRNQYTALKAKIPFLDINQERHQPYSGYVGLIEMAKEFDRILSSPIWQQVRESAPWREYQMQTQSKKGFDINECLKVNLDENIGEKTNIVKSKKPATVNPLKQSSPLGASLAFLGLKNTVPLFHGSQGCTAFAKVLLVRHFREAIPVATTAMNNVSTILGGEDHVEQAILALVEKAKPEMIGLFTTGLTETRGDDMHGILKSIRERHPELDYLPIIFASTPDYKGGLQDGFALAVQSIVSTDYSQFPSSPIPEEENLNQVTILAGSLLSPGDVAEIKEIVTNFGLKPLVIPDLSNSLDGHLADDYLTTSAGGTDLASLQQLGRSSFTIAIGESMRESAEILQQKYGTNYQVFPRLTGLGVMDKFITLLAKLVNDQNQAHSLEVPAIYEHQRRQLQDAILDSHFYLSGKKVAIALEPDLLYQTSWLLKEMGAEIQVMVTTTNAPILKELPVNEVIVGDLEDLEDLAKGADLIITNSQGKDLAHRLHIPLYRMGYPIYDRLGNGSRCLVGYGGTMQFLFDVANIFIDLEH